MITYPLLRQACYHSTVLPLQAPLSGLDFMSERCWEDPTEIKRDGSVRSSTLCLSLFLMWMCHYHSLSGLATFCTSEAVGVLLNQSACPCIEKKSYLACFFLNDFPAGESRATGEVLDFYAVVNECYNQAEQWEMVATMLHLVSTPSPASWPNNQPAA